MRKTKIIATIGPASEKPEVFEAMVKAGLNVARLNMSHGTYPEHKSKIDLIKDTNKKLGSSVALMLDTKGPEIRLGDFDAPEILLEEGNKFTLTTKEVIGNKDVSYVTYKNITKDVKDKFSGITQKDLQNLHKDLLANAVDCAKIIELDFVCCHKRATTARLPAGGDFDRTLGGSHVWT